MNLERACSIVLLVILVTSAGVASAQEQLPWLEAIGARSARQDIHTVAATASVIVSDGKTYSVRTVFHDHQRAVFQRVYPDRTVSQGVEGHYVWSYDGDTETEASPFVGQVVLGHQFHAELLFFDRLHGLSGPPETGEFNGKECLSVAGKDTTEPRRVYFDADGRPLGLTIARTDMPDIQVAFEDWRRVEAFEFPFLLIIDDGEREFRYQYSAIDINQGAMADFRAPYEVLTDEQKLLRRHRIAMDDHLFGRTDGIKASRADALVIASNGEIYNVTGAEFDAMIEGIMRSRDYTVYDDLIRPVVEVSEDGTQGRVIVQVYARGHRLDDQGRPGEHLEFHSTWVSLFRKFDGEWKLTGNVSNVRYAGD